ncbi:hypothetical protein [Sporosarcina aquimarina]|uniref:hypothetical protein n=1 Tax=Sporosarcina aquimarina TaxID=114975 RepID=UPI001C8DB5BA|nr:hypothetical protein [Sporosarcina aquimarina]MBY0221960.1 hypothetical protein [Sporosarcina aquimarina]
MEKTTMTIIEALGFCVDKDVKNAQKRLDSFLKNGKLATNQKKTLKEEMKRFYENVEVTSGGKQGRVILSGMKDEPTERITGNSTNGYKQSDAEMMLISVIADTVATKYDEIKKYKYGLSYNQWAYLLGLPKVDTSTEYEKKSVEHLKKQYNMDENEFFKPNEIVDEFNRAISNVQKALIQKAFKSMEGVKVTTYYIAGKPNKDNPTTVVYDVVPEEKYKKMKETRKEILKYHGSSLYEYFSHIKKPKNERMTEIFKAVRDGLQLEYDVTQFHEQSKIEFINEDDVEGLKVQILTPVKDSFWRHFNQRSITYRHSNKNYKISTYFWKRFYYLNTCYLLELDELAKREIDTELMKSLKKSFSNDFANYLHSFDMDYYLPIQLKKESGHWGDMTVLLLSRHIERLEQYQNEMSVDKSVVDVKEQLGDFFDATVKDFKQIEQIHRELEIQELNECYMWELDLENQMPSGL